MIPLTFGSTGTPLILRTLDYFENIQKVLGLRSTSQAAIQESRQSLGLYEHTHQTGQTCRPKV